MNEQEGRLVMSGIFTCKLRDCFKKLFFGVEGRILRLKKRKDVLFVINSENMFNQAYPLYQILADDPRIRCWFCYQKPARFEDLKALRRQYRLRWLPYTISKKIKWDLILFPDHGGYFRKDIKKIYMGHGISGGKIVDGHPYVFGPNSLDENGEVIYEKIFNSSEYAVSKISKCYPKFYPYIRVVGRLFVDQLLSYSEDQRKSEILRLKFEPGKKTIMLTSTWGPDSMIQQLGLDFVHAVEALRGSYNVIVSLHFLNFIPNSFKGLKMEELFRSPMAGVHIVPPHESGTRYLPLADLLVMDHTSLGFYYTVLQRPIIFYDNPQIRYAPNSLIFDLREVAYRVSDLSQIGTDIDRAFANFDSSKIQSLAYKTFSYQGQAKKRYLEEILDSLGLET
jgi:hypothetical protein